MFIAIDFDDTIFHTINYPSVEQPLKNAIRTIKDLYNKGHVLTLWTCREEDHLELAKDKLREYNILQYFTYFNENSKEKTEAWSNSRKIGADYFIDDRAGFKNWNEIRRKFDLDKTLFKKVLTFFNLT